MCVACTEFIKGTLTGNEFRSALRETTREDKGHLDEVEWLLGQDALKDEELRAKLKAGSALVKKR